MREFEKKIVVAYLPLSNPNEAWVCKNGKTALVKQSENKGLSE